MTKQQIVGWVSYAVLLCSLGACSGKGWFFVAEPPPQPPVDIAVILDCSTGSPCAVEPFAATVSQAVVAAAARPGSRVQVYWMGDQASDLELVDAIMVPVPRGTTPKNRLRSRDEFITTTTKRLRDAAVPFLNRPRPRHSPVLETAVRIGLALPASDHPRYYLFISDAREQSDLARTECGPLPSPDALTTALTTSGVLTRSTFARTRIAFCFMTDSRTGKCPWETAKAIGLRALWRKVIETAGGKVEFYAGAPEPTLFNPEQ